MKITVTPDGGQPVILGDDNIGDFVEADLPEQTRAVQVSQPSRAAHVQPIARAKRSNGLAWTVERIHADYDAATIFKYTHAEEVPLSGLVEVSHNNQFQLFYVDAVVAEVRCVYHKGITTRFLYRLVSGRIQTTNPNLTN